ncbi:MAG: hypothetical protein HYY06_24280 [Deltaproteobacteria bacterium]|nr:hypothetical protein [Deltaproteobacteria bacterium]
MRLLRAIAVCCTTLAACGTGSGPTDDTVAGLPGAGEDGGEPAPLEIDGPCPVDARIGAFLIEAQEEFSLVDGAVADGVVPASVPEEVLAEGDCRLLRRRNPFCDPPCLAGQTCGLDGACIPFPSNQDVGTVTVTGLVDPVEIQPLQPGNRYSFTDLPNPAFEPGAEIRLRTTSGRYGELGLDGLGFVPIAPGDAWTIAPSEPLDVRWDAPEDALTRVELRVDIDQHGNSPVSLVCDLPDTGSARIPSSLVDALLGSGVSGFPSGRLARGTTDSLDVDGASCVELSVASPRSVAVRVEGHVPCDGDDACPDGQSCDLATNTCR